MEEMINKVIASYNEVAKEKITGLKGLGFNRDIKGAQHLFTNSLGYSAIVIKNDVFVIIDGLGLFSTIK